MSPAAAPPGADAPMPRDRLAVGLLALACYVPLLLTHRGMVGADTKSYLYLDPDRLLSRAWSMWDPNVGMGTVPHQNIGYLWPMGPYYWVFEHLGIPDWVAQRLWLGSILFVAGLGVRSLLRALGQAGPGVGAAMFLYALSPYVLTLGARISALLLPFAALGWLLSLTVRACRERTWLHPALFALVVPTAGSSNATALLLVGLAPALWLPYATFVLRELRLRSALGVAARIGVLSVATSVWWIVGLWCQGSFGLDVLRYTETARTVAESSSAPEVLRGLGYWYFYGADKLGPWIEPSEAYTQSPALLALTYAIPIIAIAAAGIVRWRYRSYFVGLLAVGLFVAVGAYPWTDPVPLGQGFRSFLGTQAGLAMRSLPRAVPLVALALAVLTGVAVNGLGRRVPRLARPSGVALGALALLGLPPLWLGQMVADNLQRDEDVPSYWTDAAAEIDARGQVDGIYTSRVLEVPGSDFASYRWGDTVDPITPGLTDRPYVARELIPYGSPASADLLNALDRQLQEAVLAPEAIAPVARLMGVGDIVLRGDLAYERYNLVRPRQTFALLEAAEGIGPVTGFGGTEPNVPDPRLPLRDELELAADPDLPNPPQVGLFEVEGEPAMVTATPVSSTIVLAGDAEGIIAAAAAGLIDGDEALRYSATFGVDGGGGADALRAAAAEGAAVVLTDTNRRAARRWGAIHETNGATETVDGGVLVTDPGDNRLPVFPGTGSDTQTVVIHEGLTAKATSYGNSVTYTGEDRAANAVDDDPATAWYVSAFAPAVGERIELTYESPRSTDRIRLLQAARGVQGRWITEVRIRFDGGPPETFPLDETSRSGEGQWVDVGDRTFEHLAIEVAATDPGGVEDYGDQSGVGFADIRLGDDDVRLEEVVRPPTDLLDALGDSSLDRPLAIVLTRLRARPTAALRSDEEPTMVRLLELPTGRDATVTGTARLSALAPEAVVDRLLGRPTLEEGGITASSSRRLPGDVSAGATAAIDGDPSTHWSPGFLGQDAEWARYQTASPVTFDHLDLTVVADGRHTVPTALRVEVDGEEVAVVDVPAITDVDQPDATTSVRVDLPGPVTGSDVRIGIADSREVSTRDWVSESPVVMPVGIAEWGIEGLRAAPVDEQIDTGCRSDLVEVDGEPVPVRITGTTAAAEAGEPLVLAGCSSVALPEGTSRLETGHGVDRGLQVDSLTLLSDAGGAASEAVGPLAVDPEEPPTVTVTRQARTATSVTVGPRSEDTWLVVGQSDNPGWRATADGTDLGPPVLLDGYSAAFRIPAGSDPVEVEVEWWPQQVVDVGLGISAVAAVGCAVLALLGLRRRRRHPAEVRPGEPVDEAPAPWPTAALLHSPGSAPGWVATALTAVAAAGAGVATSGAASGLVLAAAAVAGLRLRRAAPLLTLGPAALIAAAGAYVLTVQVRRSPSWGFGWPSSIDGAHPLATTAVLLLVLAVVVERLRTGSWLVIGEPDEDEGTGPVDQAGMATDDPPATADR